MNWTDIFAAWGTTDATSWIADVEALTTEGVYYADPHTGPVEGRTGLIAVIEQFRTLMPDGSAVARDADGYDGHARAAVDFAVPRSPRIKTPPIRGLTAFNTSARRMRSWPTIAVNGYTGAKARFLGLKLAPSGAARHYTARDSATGCQPLSTPL